MNFNVRVETLSNGYMVSLSHESMYILNTVPVGTYFKDMDAVKAGIPNLIEVYMNGQKTLAEQARQEQAGMKQSYAQEQNQAALNKAAQGRFYDERR